MKRTLLLKVILAGAVSIITGSVYLSALRNEFVYWDDSVYVLDNPYIRSLDSGLLRFAFLDFYSYNWHPLTWISHALDYAVWGLNPLGHHLTNVIIHAVNTLLVVFLAIKLIETAGEAASEKAPAAVLNERAVLAAGAVTGLLFGLHPLHVESVAWIAERKDLLCAVFFLPSIIMYLKYAIDAGSGSVQPARGPRLRHSWYLLSLGSFVLALLSKPMAVSLPLVLLILDWYPLKRIRSLSTFREALVEKMPFIAMSFVSSILTMLAQKSGSAIWEAVPLPTRILVAAESLITYLWKMVLPLNLLPFYPHPRNASLLSPKYLAAVGLVAGITATCLFMARRQKIWLSAWGYYVFTLLPVLGVVQVGGQSMADRYTYLPSLGPFLLAGIAAVWVFGRIQIAVGRHPVLYIGSAAVAVLVFISLSYLTLRQTAIWKDSLTLWNYVIEKEPRRVLLAYYNRGNAYARMGDYRRAIDDFSVVIALNYQEYSKPYIDRGFAYLKIGQVGLAVADLRKACALGDDFGCKSLDFFEKKDN